MYLNAAKGINEWATQAADIFVLMSAGGTPTTVQTDALATLASLREISDASATNPWSLDPTSDAGLADAAATLAVTNLNNAIAGYNQATTDYGLDSSEANKAAWLTAYILQSLSARIAAVAYIKAALAVRTIGSEGFAAHQSRVNTATAAAINYGTAVDAAQAAVNLTIALSDAPLPVFYDHAFAESSDAINTGRYGPTGLDLSAVAYLTAANGINVWDTHDAIVFGLISGGGTPTTVQTDYLATLASIISQTAITLATNPWSLEAGSPAGLADASAALAVTDLSNAIDYYNQATIDVTTTFNETTTLAWKAAYILKSLSARIAAAAYIAAAVAIRLPDSVELEAEQWRSGRATAAAINYGLAISQVNAFANLKSNLADVWLAGNILAAKMTDSLPTNPGALLFKPVGDLGQAERTFSMIAWPETVDSSGVRFAAPIGTVQGQLYQVSEMDPNDRPTDQVAAAVWDTSMAILRATIAASYLGDMSIWGLILLNNVKLGAMFTNMNLPAYDHYFNDALALMLGAGIPPIDLSATDLSSGDSVPVSDISAMNLMRDVFTISGELNVIIEPLVKKILDTLLALPFDKNTALYNWIQQTAEWTVRDLSGEENYYAIINDIINDVSDDWVEISSLFSGDNNNWLDALTIVINIALTLRNYSPYNINTEPYTRAITDGHTYAHYLSEYLNFKNDGVNDKMKTALVYGGRNYAYGGAKIIDPLKGRAGRDAVTCGRDITVAFDLAPKPFDLSYSFLTIVKQVDEWEAGVSGEEYARCGDVSNGSAYIVVGGNDIFKCYSDLAVNYDASGVIDTSNNAPLTDSSFINFRDLLISDISNDNALGADASWLIDAKSINLQPLFIRDIKQVVEYIDNLLKAWDDIVVRLCPSGNRIKDADLADELNPGSTMRKGYRLQKLFIPSCVALMQPLLKNLYKDNNQKDILQNALGQIISEKIDNISLKYQDIDSSNIIYDPSVGLMNQLDLCAESLNYNIWTEPKYSSWPGDGDGPAPLKENPNPNNNNCLWLDDVHPTKEGHKLIAKYLVGIIHNAYSSSA